MKTLFVACLVTLLHLTGITTASADSIPVPKDVPYPGTIALHVDATDIERRIFRVRQTMPVKPGPLTLLYPEWLPGTHAPRGPIEALAGVTILAGDRRLEWTRDPLSTYAFNVKVPAGVKELQIELQYASPQTREQGRITATAEILGVQWEKMLLYPAGYYASRIPFAAHLTLPEGWKYGTALEAQSDGGESANVIRFRPVPLETLIDSPLFAGKYFSRVDLDPGAKAPVHLNIVADSPEELSATPEQIETHRKLVREATTLFASRHFDRYDFLLAISDRFGRIGLEHHRSSENGVRPGYFKEWDKNSAGRDLLAHEMVHSWNGKFRRPANLWTPNYSVPMQNTLLWVYEGQTQYWGYVLAVRSGLWSAQMGREAIASLAAMLQEKRAGRRWRDLEDTTHQPIVTPRRPLSWVSWQRTEDYYTEGLMIWLDIDTRIRELTGNKRSLDDFASAFFGIQDGSYVPATYTFDDVARTLNTVVSNDWAAFLKARIHNKTTNAPLDGLERGGWKLVFTAEPSDFTKKSDQLNDRHDFSYSIGAVLDKDAKFTEVVWDGPAFKAGISTAGTLIAVNGLAYKPERLKQAIQDTKDKNAPLTLLVKDMDYYRSVTLDYSGGLRYPQLQRIDGVPDRLSDILKPRT